MNDKRPYYSVQSLNVLSGYLKNLVKGKLWLKVIFAIILGVGFGFLFNAEAGVFSSKISNTICNWLALPGQLFLRLVQMIMIPLIFTSIISGIISNNIEQIRSMGLKLLGYFLFTTVISIIIGASLAIIFQPGSYIDGGDAFNTGGDALSLIPTEQNAPKSIPDSISELIPSNPLASMMSGEMLSIVIFTIIIGLAISQLKTKIVQPIVDVFFATQEICMQVVSWAMKLVPFAVFGLITQLVSNVGTDGLAGIGVYMLVVLLGLVLLLMVYMIILKFFAKINPFKFLKSIKDVQLLAFSTTSSAAVMPLSMKTADEKLGVSSKISDFVIPIGATVNMDGTAVFQCISALFIAQSYGMEMEIANILLILVTIVAASIGTPAIPGGGVIILASVLESSGIPTEGLVIIIGVDRILGMFRTAVNVTGDLTACVLFDRLAKRKI